MTSEREVTQSPSDCEPGSPPCSEVSPVNPSAVRGPNGIWNEESLPVLAWEVAEYRVVLPQDVQAYIGLDSPVVRVPIEVHEKLTFKHAAAQHVYDELSMHLLFWTQRGRVIGEGGDARWRFVVSVATSSGKTSPYVIVFARRRDATYTLVTAHYRNESYVRRLIAEGALEQREAREE